MDNNIIENNTMIGEALGVIIRLLVIVGAINWGLVGLFDFNLVSLAFGEDTLASNIAYCTIGGSGMILLVKYIITLISSTSDR